MVRKCMYVYQLKPYQSTGPDIRVNLKAMLNSKL